MVISEAQPLDKIFLKMFCNYEFCFNFFFEQSSYPTPRKIWNPSNDKFQRTSSVSFDSFPF